MWNDLLVQEHEWIEKVISIIEIELNEQNPSIKRLSRAIDFLLEIGDKLHNQKEELYLFPLMEQKGIPREGGPISVMLYEHSQEKEILTGLSQLLVSADGFSSITNEFKNNCFQYFMVRKNHIWKENDVLYNMAFRVFTQDDHALLTKQLLEMDTLYYGEGARQKYQEMVDDIVNMGTSEKLLLQNLSYDQINNIMETLPFEVTFVGADDAVAYFNRLDKEKIFVRSRSAIGRQVEKCHPGKSVNKVLEIVNGFKDKSLDQAEFWINFRGKMVYIQYFPVRDEKNNYQGVLEVTMDVTHIRALEGEKRLL